MAWENSVLPKESLEEGTVLLLPLLGRHQANSMTEAVGLDVAYAKLEYGPEDFSPQRGKDVVAFLMGMYKQYKADALAVLRHCGRKGIGCQIVPVVFDTGYSGWMLAFDLHTNADAIAAATYMDESLHDPSQPTKMFQSRLKSPPEYNNWIADRRIKGMPTFIYEFGIFNPQKYKIEMLYRLFALAAIQDIDVIDWHYYGHPSPFYDVKTFNDYRQLEYMSPGFIWSGVLLRMDEVMMSAMRVVGDAFKHGYLQPAKNPVTITVSRDFLYGFKGFNGGDFGKAAQRNAMLQGVQWNFTDRKTGIKADKHLISKKQLSKLTSCRPTNQILFDWKQGILAMSASQFCALVGTMPDKYTFHSGLKFEDIHIDVPKGMLLAAQGERFAAIGIVSEDGLTLAKSGKILLSAVSTSCNTGLQIDTEKLAKDKTYAYSLAKAIKKYGAIPVQVARVGVTIKAPWLKGRRYKMFDFNYQVIREGVIENNALTIDSKLPVYVVEISR